MIWWIKIPKTKRSKKRKNLLKIRRTGKEAKREGVEWEISKKIIKGKNQKKIHNSQ